MLPGSISTERFTCPKCGLGYQAIKEWFPDDVSGGRFECIECFAEVHSWSGLYDYIGWIPVGRSSWLLVKYNSPGPTLTPQFDGGDS